MQSVLYLLVSSVLSQCAFTGKEVQVEGLVMDQLCIDRGTLFDNPTVKTLENPVVHSVKCLIDVPECVASGFSILAPPATPGGLYTVKYQLGVEGTQLAVKAGEEARKNVVSLWLLLELMMVLQNSNVFPCQRKMLLALPLPPALLPV
jgi:hypothetical protein